MIGKAKLIRWGTRGAVALPLALIATASAADGGSHPVPLTHAAEIETFGTTMAIAQTASDQCADMLINMPMLKAIRDEMHIVDAVDGQAMVEHGRQVMNAVRQAIAKSGRQEWCDAAYRMYGPDGKLIPRLMSRQ